MELLIVRHAIAFERNIHKWPEDSDRPLSPLGVRPPPSLPPTGPPPHEPAGTRQADRRDSEGRGRMATRHRACGAGAWSGDRIHPAGSRARALPNGSCRRPPAEPGSSSHCVPLGGRIARSRAEEKRRCLRLVQGRSASRARYAPLAGDAAYATRHASPLALAHSRYELASQRADPRHGDHPDSAKSREPLRHSFECDTHAVSRSADTEHDTQRKSERMRENINTS